MGVGVSERQTLPVGGPTPTDADLVGLGCRQGMAIFFLSSSGDSNVQARLRITMWNALPLRIFGLGKLGPREQCQRAHLCCKKNFSCLSQVYLP